MLTYASSFFTIYMAMLMLSIHELMFCVYNVYFAFILTVTSLTSDQSHTDNETHTETSNSSQTPQNRVRIGRVS